MPWSWLRCVAPRLTSQASWSIRISTPSPGHDFNKAKTSLDSRLFSVKSISFLQRLAYNVLLRPGSEFFGFITGRLVVQPMPAKYVRSYTETWSLSRTRPRGWWRVRSRSGSCSATWRLSVIQRPHVQPCLTQRTLSVKFMQLSERTPSRLEPGHATGRVGGMGTSQGTVDSNSP